MEHLPSTRAEAKAAGSLWYYTGKPCKRGHVSDRQTANGMCRICGVAKCNKYGAENKHKRLAYIKANADIRREKAKEYWARNREAMAAHRATTIDIRREQMKQYAQRNRIQLRAWARERAKERYAGCPVYRLSAICRGMVQRVSRQRKPGTRTAELLGYTPSDLREHLQSLFAPGMTWENMGEWHIDHIIPLSVLIKRGETDPAVINALSNLQPLWARDNILKGAKIYAAA